MRNQEAARYARWSAIAAGGLVLLVAGFFAERAVRGYIARRHGPAPVPATVAQQQADFTYSDSSGPDGRATFTIRASHFTQFKDQDRAMLEDVWVTIYGRKGDRNDEIHTRECSYQPNAQIVQCTGEVEIDMQAGGAGGSNLFGQSLQVKTSNLSFDRGTGRASTPAAVVLEFPGGHGSGGGLEYDSGQSVLRLTRGVQLAMEASPKTGGLPAGASAASLEFRRDDRSITLGGPVVMRQGERELSAARILVGLDRGYRVQTITADGDPVLSGAESGAKFQVAAQEFQAVLEASGAVQRVVAGGGVEGTRQTKSGEDHFSAPRVEFAMLPGRNLLDSMTASGGVAAESRAGAAVRTVKTEALRLRFASAATDDAKAGPVHMDKQRIEGAESLGPARLESRDPSATLDVNAAKFAAEFGEDGRVRKLLGHNGVEITRTAAGSAPETSTAAELVADFDSRGAWTTVEETGHVRLTQGAREATAGHARIAQDTGLISLDGSPVFSDGTTRTTAGSVAINQKTGEIRAGGGIVTIQLAAKGQSGSAISLGEGEAHISSDSLTGSTLAGDVTFLGHARLWQGQAALNADEIAVSQKQGTLEAVGHVAAVFPQIASQGPQLPTVSAAGAKPSRAAAGPLIWQVRAPRLVFSNAQGVVHLEGGVFASSAQGTLHSQTLDAYLSPPSAAAASGGGASAPALAGRRLDRVVAQGNVSVSQDELRGTAEQAEYQAGAGRFTLSGGRPSVTDGAGTTTTGRSLTFDVASDTISVDSDEGSRTLTRHRVAK